MAGELARLIGAIGELGSNVVPLQKALTATRAVGPANGGKGESDKAALCEKWLRDMGITDIIHVDAPDERVPSKVRPNIIATIPGRSSKGLWLFAHLDVVAEGDLNLWKTDPWTVVQEGDLIYGRGVEDNQQGLVSMLLLAGALTGTGIQPEYTLHLVFISDEESGNQKGMAWLLQQKPDLIRKDDLCIVPDGGSPLGNEIEVAEKSILWLKVEVQGQQCHASTPQKGFNAFVAASDIVLTLTGLAKDFGKREDPLFDPPKSTFVPTRHEENVANVNIMPGKDVFYIDCRLLPGLEPEEVITRARQRAEEVAKRREASVTITQAMLERASQTAVDAPVVKALSAAIRTAGGDPKPVGIGGGTVAAMLRAKGIPAAVWSTIKSCCHEPNEHSSISATIRDAQIFALVAMGHE